MREKILKISKYRPSVFQAQLDFSNRRNHISLTLEHPLERTAVKVLVAILAILLTAYLYFVSASVLNVIARKDAMVQTTQLQGSIGILEQQYFALSQGVTPDEATTLGLSKVADTHYLYRSNMLGAAVTRDEI